MVVQRLKWIGRSGNKNNRERENAMLTAVESTYSDGKIELTEAPLGVADEAAVIVTFIQPGMASSPGINLRAHGISREQAAELRARLMPFAEDWERPERDVYDNYDAAKSQL